MSTQDVAQVLSGTALFAGLDPAPLAALAGAARVRQAAAGEVVFAEGDTASGLLVVAAGQLKVVLRSREGAELLLRVVGAGSTLGEPSLADGGVRSATVTALGPATLVQLDAPAVLACAAAHPVVAVRLMTTLAELVRALTGTCADLVFLDLRRRVAKLLLAELHDGDAAAHLDQTELAARVGGSRQSVNAALAHLERRGWIRRRYRSVVLQDEAGLRQFAQG